VSLRVRVCPLCCLGCFKTCTNTFLSFIGVVSGVAMLFIEMTLFVIRTHEFDDGMRKKNKKNKVSPFGPVPVKPIKN
jgi:hypothetical protein